MYYLFSYLNIFTQCVQYLLLNKRVFRYLHTICVINLRIFKHLCIMCTTNILTSNMVSTLYKRVSRHLYTIYVVFISYRRDICYAGKNPKIKIGVPHNNILFLMECSKKLRSYYLTTEIYVP